MNEWDWAFLAGAGWVAWNVRQNRRALVWLLMGALSYTVSAAWHRLEGPTPLVASAACDALVVAALYAFAKQKWEMGLWRVFQIMLAINILAYAVPYSAVETVFGSGLIDQSHLHNAFLGSIDLANIIALAWIWINGAPQNVGDADRLDTAGAGFPALLGLRRVLCALHRPRPHPPFWKVAG
jgi:hypothetical protein